MSHTHKKIENLFHKSLLIFILNTHIYRLSVIILTHEQCQFFGVLRFSLLAMRERERERGEETPMIVVRWGLKLPAGAH